MHIDHSLFSIREKLLELSQGDLVQEQKLANLYFKSFQDLKDMYAVCLINQDSRLLTFIYQKYKPTLKELKLTDLSEAIQSTINLFNQKKIEDALDTPAIKVKTYCETLIQQLQQSYSWLD